MPDKALNTLRVVTLADHRFRREAGHLKRSLARSNSAAQLTVYCDDRKLFADLASERCTLVELPDMKTLGAKRSKFTAFRHAINLGSFLYLDADAIVLEPLDELFTNDVLSGCADDLSHCPFILDKQHPWPNAPELLNERYINSGIFFAPASRKPFFEELYRLSRIDSVWEKYIFPGKLLDNHFFCAHLNLKQEPIRLLDRQIYGWQGFLLEFGEVQVERRGEHLVNKVNGKVLNLVIFAGIRQSYEFILSLPVEIASLLFQRILSEDTAPNDALAHYVAAVSPQLAEVQDPHALLVLKQTFAEFRHLIQHGSGSWRWKRSYYEDPEAMRAFVCAQPASGSEWNGLKCGGAYLEGDEYNAIRDIVKRFDVRTVLETGAGESSILFSDLGVQSVSLESQPGPWLERARAHGCTVIEIAFDETQGRFEEEPLRSGLEALGLQHVDLLFIDSPIGTARRREMLSQLMGILSVRYVLYHDAMRDSVNIFRDQQTHGLRLVNFFDSVRGLVLLENTGSQVVPHPPSPDEGLDPLQVRIETDDSSARVIRVGGHTTVKITVDNQGSARLSSHAQQPVFVSYHWLNAAGEANVFEGERIMLPFDIHPGDRSAFFVNIPAPEQTGFFELQVSLVQEYVYWFNDVNHDCLITIPAQVVAQINPDYELSLPISLATDDASIVTGGFYEPEEMHGPRWSQRNGTVWFLLAKDWRPTPSVLLQVNGTAIAERPVALILNGRHLGSITKSGWVSAQYTVDQSAFRAGGENELVLSVENAGPVPGDTRTLGFKLDRIQLLPEANESAKARRSRA